MINLCKKELCTGCYSCFNACPQKCIEMEMDGSGFLYPKIDLVSCIKCQKCINACPILTINKESTFTKSYYGYNHNNELRLLSSSGGIFIEIARWIIRSKGVVFGAAFDKDLNVIHKKCDNERDLVELVGSKYVQSKIDYIFTCVKKELKNGSLVLFAGTPCQIAGLVTFLGKKPSNLYLLDIICHGVPSPFVWQKYKEYICDEFNSSIKNVDFRNKDLGWDKYSIKIDFANGKSLIEPASTNKYYLAYAMGMTIRRSCANCSFKQNNRMSDITLGDFWGIENYFPGTDLSKGYSIILVHNEKGNYLLNTIKDHIFCQEINIEDAAKSNSSLFYSTKISPLSEKFIKSAKTKRFDLTFNKYCGDNLLAKIRRKIG